MFQYLVAYNQDKHTSFCMLFYILVLLSVFSHSTCLSESFLSNPSNYKRRSSFLKSHHEGSVFFNSRDNNLVNKFSLSLKRLNGDWSGHGIQRVIRLNSECSNQFISLRSLKIKADVPLSEVFIDPYTLLEQQIYRKAVAFKSKQTNKYICFNTKRGNFILKYINQIDKYCIFFYSKKKSNQYSFSIGSAQLIALSFNKFGQLVNSRRKRQYHSCSTRKNLFNIVTKSSDNNSNEGKKNPLVIVYEAKKQIQSYSLKNGYQNIFYSSLTKNKPALTSKRKNYKNEIQLYKPYQYNRTSNKRERIDKLKQIQSNRMKYQNQKTTQKEKSFFLYKHNHNKI